MRATPPSATTAQVRKPKTEIGNRNLATNPLLISDILSSDFFHCILRSNPLYPVPRGSYVPSDEALNVDPTRLESAPDQPKRCRKADVLVFHVRVRRWSPARNLDDPKE